MSIDYGTYIQSPEWKVRRQTAIDGAGGRCQLCYSDVGPMHAHHRTYARLGHEHPGDLTVLCEECHDSHHARVDRLAHVDPLPGAEREELRLTLIRLDAEVGWPMSEVWLRVAGVTDFDRITREQSVAVIHEMMADHPLLLSPRPGSESGTTITRQSSRERSILTGQEPGRI